MSPVKRAKCTRKKCKDCKHFDGIYCLVFYTKHDPMTPRCKADYESTYPLLSRGWFWFIICMILLVIICLVMRSIGG